MIGTVCEDDHVLLSRWFGMRRGNTMLRYDDGRQSDRTQD